MDYPLAKNYILDRLEKELDPYLSYHGRQHTLDVLEMSEKIAIEEGVSGEEDLILLKTAALFHDCGFIYQYQDHERISCEIARNSLTQFNYSKKQIEVVCNLIEATKVPQQPKNKLECILADADLDYLGRNDYYAIADTLYREFMHYGVLQTKHDWVMLQINFLESHHYHTDTCIKARVKEKKKRIQELRKLI